jgi:hypothetical protein
MYINNSYYIDHCFTMGSVLAQANDSTTTLNAGGMVGYLTSGCGQIKDSVALGSSVGVKNNSSTASTRNVGRITGNALTSGLTNNYASVGGVDVNNKTIPAMTVINAPSYSGTTSQSITSSLTGKDGANVKRIFNNKDGDNAYVNTFWQNASTASPAGVAFPAANWYFGSVYRLGYPILYGSDGRVMEGQ